MIIAFTGAGISKESGIQTFEDEPTIRYKISRQFAVENPKEYKGTIDKLVKSMKNKKPNDAHLALAEYKIPIITMNIDNLHELAGSTDIIKIHGRLPKEYEIEQCHLLYNTPVLYGDIAELYAKAYDKINNLGEKDLLLIIGASNYTNVSQDIREIARNNSVQIIEIQNNAVKRVRTVIEKYKDKININ